MPQALLGIGSRHLKRGNVDGNAVTRIIVREVEGRREILPFDLDDRRTRLLIEQFPASDHEIRSHGGLWAEDGKGPARIDGSALVIEEDVADRKHGGTSVAEGGGCYKRRSASLVSYRLPDKKIGRRFGALFFCGGGGNRTRVREPSVNAGYKLSPELCLVLGRP